MLARRVVVCLDVQGGRVVKGEQFVRLRDVGDPVELATRYEEEGADEIVFLDISASADERATLLGKRFASDPALAGQALDSTSGAVRDLPDWTAAALEAVIEPFTERIGVKRGELYGLIRVAVAGTRRSSSSSPPPRRRSSSARARILPTARGRSSARASGWSRSGRRRRDSPWSTSGPGSRASSTTSSGTASA